MSYIGGLVGTVVMTMMVLYGDKMGMMKPGFNMITDGLGKMMNDKMGLPVIMGWVAHLMIGIVIHPLLYSIVWVGIFGFEGVIMGIVFALIFAMMMIAMLPILGVESEWKMKTSMGIILAHIAYGAVFALEFWPF